MKRLIMFALPILFVVGIVNGQDNQWKQTQLTWSSETTQTILQAETKYTDTITLSETIIGSRVSSSGVIESQKFPSKLSFELIAVENTGDSSNVIHTLQLSGDGITFFDFVVIDTSLSVATANQTYAMFEVVSTIADFEYARVKSVFASGITDTVDLSGYMSERFTP